MTIASDNGEYRIKGKLSNRIEKQFYGFQPNHIYYTEDKSLSKPKEFRRIKLQLVQRSTA